MDHKVLSPIKFSDATSQERARTIYSSVTCVEKYTPSGEFDKLKARLLGGGDKSDRTFYDDVYAPTVRKCNLLTLASIAAKEKRFTAKGDIKSAFLNARKAYKPGQPRDLIKVDPLIAKYFVELYPSLSEYAQSDGSLLFVLTGALYGTPDAPALWNKHFTGTLLQLGYKQCIDDPVSSANQLHLVRVRLLCG